MIFLKKTSKKVISIILSVLMLMAYLPTMAFAETSGYYSYYLDDNQNVLITDVDTSISGDVTIPSTIDGHPVATIGNESFSHCDLLTSVTIPDSVTSIGGWAFSNCTSLTNITIPDSVTSIGDQAFEECASLTSITLPSNVTYIGFGAFSGCTSMTSIILTDSITTIGWYVFDACDNLSDVYYTGTEEQWNNIIMERTALSDSATIHFNYVPHTEHTLGAIGRLQFLQPAQPKAQKQEYVQFAMKQKQEKSLQ